MGVAQLGQLLRCFARPYASACLVGDALGGLVVDARYVLAQEQPALWRD